MSQREMVETVTASTTAASVRTSGLAAAFERWRPYALSLLRIVVGLLFLEHGTSKVLGFPPHGAIPIYPNIEWFAGRIEFIGGSLVALGIYTRFFAFLLSGEMAIGYFVDHAPRSFFPLLSGGDPAVLFCFIFFYLTFSGGGPLSLDALIWGRGTRS